MDVTFVELVRVVTLTDVSFVVLAATVVVLVVVVVLVFES